MKSQDSPKIGMLCWEEGQIPRGLIQTDTLCGSSTNPATYQFPIRYFRVKGANIQTVLENPDPQILDAMINGIKVMADEGVRAVGTSCGFNAIFQRELADAAALPVFTSSLLQVPYLLPTLGKEQTIGIITAKKAALTNAHLRAVGISQDSPLHIFGLEDCPEWAKIFHSPEEDVDLQIIEREVVGVALEAKRLNQNIGVFVLECTDLPPFAQAILERTGCPVFDVVTMINHVSMAVTHGY
jgi:hypothetical protein